MKNILFVASDNAKTSGAFLCMVKLCELLRDEHNCNVIVVLPGDGDGKELLDAAGIKNYIVKSCTWAVPNEWSDFRTLRFGIKMWLYNLPAKKRIQKIIRKEKIDIVHMNTSWTYVGARPALKEGVVLIWHLREMLEEDQNRHIILHSRGHNLIKKADRVIAVSDFVFDKYKNVIGSKLTKVYEGLDETVFYKEKELFFSPPVSILSIGLIVEKKGQWQVLEACKYLKEKGYTDIEIKIVGRGPKDYLERLKKTSREYGIDKMVKFCGSTSNPDEYYRKSDVLILSSAAEAFGRTTVEGMMEGCLVIGANAGATPDLLGYGKYGLLYEYGKSEELAERIIYALNNIDKAKKLAKDGQEYALHNFTAKENANQIYKIYSQYFK